MSLKGEMLISNGIKGFGIKGFLVGLLLPVLLFAGEDFKGEIFFDPRISTDLRDVQTGLRIGDEEQVNFVGPLRLFAFLDAEFWPLPRGTRVTVDETEDYVIRRAWYAVGPGAGAAWPLTTWAAVTTAGGISRSLGGDAPGGWDGWVDAGFRFDAPEKANWWSLLYQYHPLPGFRDHRLALQVRLGAI